MQFAIEDGPRVQILWGECKGMMGVITKHYLPDNPLSVGQRPAWYIVADGGGDPLASMPLTDDYDGRNGLWYSEEEFQFVFNETAEERRQKILAEIIASNNED